MKKRGKEIVRRIIIYLIPAVLVFITFTGCKNGSFFSRWFPSETAESREKDGPAWKELDIDVSRNVNLVFYMLGDGPRDIPLIEELVNEMTREELNCTVEFNFTTWSDYMQRYSLLLSSGQSIDLIFTSEWLNYSQYAKQGAFKALDSLIQEYAPELYKFVPTDYWNAVKIDGRIYTIPATFVEYINEGFLYREDLRKKYGLPEPDSLENIEKYLEGIVLNEPNRIVTSEIVIDNGFGPFFSAFSVLNIKYRWVDFNMPYGLAAEYDNPDKIYSYWETQDFIDDMYMFKRWADKKFWSKSALSNKNSIHDSFVNDFSAAIMSGENPIKFNRKKSLMEIPGSETEVGYFPYCRVTGLVKPVHPIHNGFAIPNHGKNPERALMFYEKLVLDKRYNHLTQYGIEGTHYTVDQEGYYQMIGDFKSNGFTRESMNSWAWRNPDLMLFDRNYDIINKMFREFDEYAQPDIFLGFAEDYTPYQAERAALFSVQSQYLAPLQAGMVKDVDAAIQVFLEMAHAAGLDTIQREYIRQWKQYCTDNGLD